MNIASVVICNAARQYDRQYHYSIPEKLAGRILPGMRVLVPFGKGNRTKEAYVLEVLDNTGMGELKEIKDAIDPVPVLTPGMLSLASWMKERYICTYSEAIHCMLPAGIGVKSSTFVKLTGAEGNVKPALRKILDFIKEAGGECTLDEIKDSLGARGIAAHLKALESDGFVSTHEEYRTAVRSKTVRAAYLTMPRDEVADEIESNRIRRIQHIRILEMLLDNEYITVPDIVRFAGVTPGVLDTLKKNGYIDFMDIEVQRDPLGNRHIPDTFPLPPTDEQSEVLREIGGSIEKEEFSEVLLHGVTGSGKTEVYLQLIRKCIETGRQAIVLVPEISLTPQMVERFKGRFGDDVAVLHSRLSLGERYDQWRLILNGKIKIAIGARSAIFAPFMRLGIVIIDEEHENTYKSEFTPKYHARDVARERCKYDGAVLLYGSATPSVETYYRASRGEIRLLEMKQRANNAQLPRVELVDMRKELDEGNRSIFSRKLAGEIARNIDAKQQTILFLNRRGYASFVMCRNCGLVVMCPNCNISLTYHAHDGRLICHYCGYTVKSPQTCPKCKSSYIRHFGTGTQRVEEEARKSFDGCTVLRMDMDTTSCKNSHERILRCFRDDNVNILIGTQMIAKGHDFPNVTLVGVLAADSLLNTGDFRASERTFQLLTQVAGRAGRGEQEGRVVIQTYNTEDFSIQAACRQDYSAFYSQEIRIREQLNYPPFTNIATVILSGVNDKQTYLSAREMREVIGSAFAGLKGEAEILGPARAPLSRIKNKFRWRIIIKCDNLDNMIKALEQASEVFSSKKKSLVELNMDINPVNML